MLLVKIGNAQLIAVRTEINLLDAGNQTNPLFFYLFFLPIFLFCLIINQVKSRRTKQGESESVREKERLSEIDRETKQERERK